MSISEAQRLYNALKESGELKQLYKSMKGYWAKDEKKFMQQYEEAQKFIDDAQGVIDLDDDEFTGQI